MQTDTRNSKDKVGIIFINKNPNGCHGSKTYIHCLEDTEEDRKEQKGKNKKPIELNLENKYTENKITQRVQVNGRPSKSTQKFRWTAKRSSSMRQKFRRTASRLSRVR